jgi:uncharacterized protein (DUF1330 family)
MPAYIIAEHDISDSQTYARARPGAAAAIARFGGRYLVNGLGVTELIEGTEPVKRLVILEFPDLDTARAFYESEDYRDAKAFRHAAARSRLVLAEGTSGSGM